MLVAPYSPLRYTGVAGLQRDTREKSHQGVSLSFSSVLYYAHVLLLQYPRVLGYIWPLEPYCAYLRYCWYTKDTATSGAFLAVLAVIR